MIKDNLIKILKNKSTLHILIGNIGAGKSTFLQSFFPFPKITVSRDGIRYALGAGQYLYDKTTEPIVHSTALYTCDRLCKASLKHIVIDETNITKRNRKFYIDIAKYYKYYCVAWVLPRLDRATSVGRRLASPHGKFKVSLWNKVWDMMEEAYICPTKEEGFNHIICLSKKDIGVAERV